MQDNENNKYYKNELYSYIQYNNFLGSMNSNFV